MHLSFHISLCELGLYFSYARSVISRLSESGDKQGRGERETRDQVRISGTDDRSGCIHTSTFLGAPVHSLPRGNGRSGKDGVAVSLAVRFAFEDIRL